MSDFVVLTVIEERKDYSNATASSTIDNYRVYYEPKKQCFNKRMILNLEETQPYRDNPAKTNISLDRKYEPHIQVEESFFEVCTMLGAEMSPEYQV